MIDLAAIHPSGLQSASAENRVGLLATARASFTVARWRSIVMQTSALFEASPTLFRGDMAELQAANIPCLSDITGAGMHT